MDATCYMYMYRYVYHLILIATAVYTIKGDDLCLDKLGKLELSCPQQDSIIVSADVLAGKGQCETNQAQCYGESAYLLVDVHRCYWQNNCTVQFPTDPIIRVPVDSWKEANTCFGEIADFLKFNDFRCFKPTLSGSTTSMIDICATRDANVGYSLESGLIRSHAHYPWLYEPHYLSQSKSCAIELYRRHQKQLLVSVLDLGLDDYDSLRLTSTDLDNNVKQNITFTSTTSVTVPDAKVTIDFNTGGYSNGGRGFLICFAFVDERDSITDACEHMLQQGKARTTLMVAEEPEVKDEKEPKQKVCRNKKGKVKKCRDKKNRKKKDGKKRKNKRDRKKKGGKKRRQEKS